MWVLIIITFATSASGGTAIHSVPYTDQANCLKAVNDLRAMSNWQTGTIKAVCEPR